jgi:butyrate kinase
MKAVFRILVINPGSTSTKIAIFENDQVVHKETIEHPSNVLKGFGDVQGQLNYRKKTIEESVKSWGVPMDNIDAFVGRGGGLTTCAGGTYGITDVLVRDAGRAASGQHHPAQLASQICKSFMDEFGGVGFVVNPPDTDEFDEIARICGVKGMYRESRTHALNQKEIAIRYCAASGTPYNSSNLIICHIGGGVSITAHRGGRMVDSNDILNGDGPIMPTRSGSLASLKVVKMAFSGEYTEKELVDKLNRNGGLMDHLGTADALEVERRINNCDLYAKLVYDAMIYQIGKNVGMCACALKGKVDAIILTGGISGSRYVTDSLKKYIEWIAKVIVMAGEFEMEALAAGALRVMRKEEKPLVYSGIPVWSGFNFEGTNHEE